MTVPGFLIKNGGAEFASRQKNLFDVLSVAEKKTPLSRSSSDEFMEIEDPETRCNKRKKTKRFRGKESLFKVPADPPPRLKALGERPAKRKRWIKYSLADVSDYELSNESNTAAAMSFLESLKERKREEEPQAVEDSTKHLFKAPLIAHANEAGSGRDEEGLKTVKPIFKSSKLIMPEYVVGQIKKVAKNTKKNLVVDRAKEVYLDHIHTYDDE